jgi:hypothetical protein
MLRDVPGGDERRLGVLTSELGVKLVGRPLDGPGLRLLEAIVQHRGLAVAVKGEEMSSDELSME